MTGRPSIFTPELGEEICRRIVGSRSLRQVCEDADMPDPATVYRWLVSEKEEHKVFCEQYTRARQAQALRWSDEIVDISDGVSPGVDDKAEADIQRDKLRVDTRKFLMGKVLPKVFGDSIAVTGANGGPIETKEVGGRDLARRVALLLAGGVGDEQPK